MSDEKKKYRHEFKYLVTVPQIAVLRARIAGLMKPDAHAGTDGIYKISSVYFDDYNNRCFYENENGTDPREKFRIRIYNHSFKRINLELKRKEQGKTLKRSARLELEDAKLLCRGPAERRALLEIVQERPALERQLITEILDAGMHSVVVVEYDRVPYVYPYGNVRVTFDTNLSSIPPEDFFLETQRRRAVMPAGMHLMEVKYDEFLPDEIYRALQIENLQRTAFSKFYLCRRYSI